MTEASRNRPGSHAAGTLGASRAEAFWRVFFHLSMPGVAAAGLLVFIGSLGFFITPSLLGGPQDTMLGQVIIIQINQIRNWPFGSALADLLVVSALVACVALDQVFGLSAVTAAGMDFRAASACGCSPRWQTGRAAPARSPAAFIFAFLNSFEELTIAMFVGGGLKSTLPKQMWDDVTLQGSPTLAAASVFVVLVVFGLFILAEFVRQRVAARAVDQ